MNAFKGCCDRNYKGDIKNFGYVTKIFNSISAAQPPAAQNQATNPQTGKGDDKTSAPETKMAQSIAKKPKIVKPKK